MVVQKLLFKVNVKEQKKNLCASCMGHKKLCGKSFCPIISKAKTLISLEKSLSKKIVFGASPPAIFIGSRNYPKVQAGPLVPPIPSIDSSIMAQPKLWINKTMDEILRYRLMLVRGKHLVDVKSVEKPNVLLSTLQEIVMASKPLDTEMQFDKKPRFSTKFFSKELISGPSGRIKKVILAENPKVPKIVDYVVSDKNFKAEESILRLYDSSINQQHITRLFSVGLLGLKRSRRLVPTEWSITAVDDILGKFFRKEIIRFPKINKCSVFGHKALGNNVQILLFPSTWMFEAHEGWLISQTVIPVVDYEFFSGRKSYANNLAGAYYATRLPVLEYLRKIRRQAGALVFMEVYPEWLPLGVWRFREICREALRKNPIKFDTISESFNELKKRLRLPLETWMKQSKLFRLGKIQTELSAFL
jgi:hypothetical protein